MTKPFFSSAVKILRQTITVITTSDLLRMAGATAFFTTFALPPVLIIIVRTFGLIVRRQALVDRVSALLTRMLGDESAKSIQHIIRSFVGLQHNIPAGIALAIFLLFVATTLFRVIKGSINELWNIRLKDGHGFRAAVRSRGMSVGVILLGGVMFLAAQVLDSGLRFAARELRNSYPAMEVVAISVVYQAFTILLMAIWFFLLFMLLPDGRGTRKSTIAGALLTSVLFAIGKFVLQFLLRPGAVGTFFGSSGALVLVLLFVFYSSIILYFGAAFTKVWGDFHDSPITPGPHAVEYELQDVVAKEEK